MKAMDLLELIGEVNDHYIEDAREIHPRSRKISPVKLILIAAAIVTLLAGCTYAVLRLQNLKMGQVVQSMGNVGYEPAAPAQGPRDVISLQGYVGSPNYLAAKEWLEFMENYDPDHKIKDTVEAHLFQAPEAYSFYGCYTQEMVDRVEEICRKYHLNPLGDLWQDEPEVIYQALGIEDVTGSANRADHGFYFADGSFHLSGEFSELVDSGRVVYDFNSFKKSSFASGYTIVSAVEDFQQWEYTTADGSQVLLARSPTRALILSDREESFESVSIVSWLTEMVDRRTLEQIADSFDFAFQTQAVDREAAEVRERKNKEATEAEAEARRKLIQAQTKVHGSYRDQIMEWMVTGRMHEIYYALYDLTGDGEPELLYSNQEHREKDLAGVYGIVDGKVTLLFSEETSMTEEARALLDRYAEAEAEWKPITEFPLE